MTHTATTLGIIGLGSMGRGAALSALRRGVPTWGFDLNPAACAAIAQAGPAAWSSPRPRWTRPCRRCGRPDWPRVACT